RIVFVVSPHGTPGALWQASMSGGTLSVDGTLAPLAPFSRQVTVVSGIDLPPPLAPGQTTHYTHPALLLTGALGSETTPGTHLGGGASLDYRLRSSATLFPQLYFAVGLTASTLESQRVSWWAADRSLVPEQSPQQTYQRLFANLTRAPALPPPGDD